jgi:hypothetical protein
MHGQRRWPGGSSLRHRRCRLASSPSPRRCSRAVSVRMALGRCAESDHAPDHKATTGRSARKIHATSARTVDRPCLGVDVGARRTDDLPF